MMTGWGPGEMPADLAAGRQEPGGEDRSSWPQPGSSGKQHLAFDPPCRPLYNQEALGSARPALGRVLAIIFADGGDILSERTFLAGRAPVPATEIEIESIGIRPLDGRRVDVAVDLTPFLGPVRVELAIVGAGDEELCTTTLVHNRDWELDKVLHLRRDAGPGQCTLHVGVFLESELVAHAARRFVLPQAAGAPDSA